MGACMPSVRPEAHPQPRSHLLPQLPGRTQSSSFPPTLLGSAFHTRLDQWGSFYTLCTEWFRRLGGFLMNPKWRSVCSDLEMTAASWQVKNIRAFVWMWECAYPAAGVGSRSLPVALRGVQDALVCVSLISMFLVSNLWAYPFKQFQIPFTSSKISHKSLTWFGF